MAFYSIDLFSLMKHNVHTHIHASLVKLEGLKSRQNTILACHPITRFPCRFAKHKHTLISFRNTRYIMKAFSTFHFLLNWSNPTTCKHRFLPFKGDKISLAATKISWSLIWLTWMKENSYFIFIFFTSQIEQNKLNNFFSKWSELVVMCLSNRTSART